MLYDAFICHASEDKESFVRPLAHLLREHHVDVWYDEFSLKLGDSLRRSIDFGLAKSRYGIVVLSPSFFKKNWTQWELDGLIQRQVSGGEDVILPIWHGVGRKEVAQFSPSLADKVAAQSRDGLHEVVCRLLNVLQPEGSTLVIERNILISYGFEPPVVTDDWWLDVAEASNGNPVEDTFQSAQGWGRWGFPLPERSTRPSERGWRLAWAAMQMKWQEKAESLPISQLTKPEVVHEFIRSQPGLLETCHDYIPFVAAYAPQLTIRGFGGDLEGSMEEAYQFFIKSRQDEIHSGRRKSGCPEFLALRDPHFGHYEPALVAGNFVQGELMGPEAKVYPTFEYVAWILSSASEWLPERIRAFLRRGLREWAVWPNDLGGDLTRFGFNKRPASTYFDALFEAAETDSWRVTSAMRKELEDRMEISVQILELPETPAELTTRLIKAGFIKDFVRQSERRRAKKR